MQKFNQEEELHAAIKTLPYYMQSNGNTMKVFIDEEVECASYYREVVVGIQNLGANDTVEFNISSCGGKLSGLEVILSALAQTEAQSVANILGECHSAASMLALNCQTVSISPYATMLVHFVSFGTSGAASHIRKHSEHVQKISERLFRKTYHNFLTEEEIEQCINLDDQLWFDAEDIVLRLKRKELLDTEEADAAEQSTECNERFSNIINFTGLEHNVDPCTTEDCEEDDECCGGCSSPKLINPYIDDLDSPESDSHICRRFNKVE